MCACFPACRILIVHLVSKNHGPNTSYYGGTYGRSNPTSGTKSGLEASRRMEKNSANLSTTPTLGGSTVIGTTTSIISSRKQGRQCYSTDDDIVELTQYPDALDPETHHGLHRLESTSREFDRDQKHQSPSEERAYV